MSRFPALSLLLTTTLLTQAALAATPEEARLVSLINAYRAAPTGCPGTPGGRRRSPPTVAWRRCA